MYFKLNMTTVGAAALLRWDGWRSTNGFVDNMKDIHWIQGLQQRPFNHVQCRSVAAKARSVHLIYSMNQKLGRKGGAGHTHSSNILLLKDAHTPTNFD